MKLHVTVEVDAPDGATHYSGDLLDDPAYYKCVRINDYGHWFMWTADRPTEWRLSHHGDTPPHHSKQISEDMICQ